MVATAPSVSTCEPFTTAEKLVACYPGDADKDPDLVALMIQAASDYLDEKLAHQFPGVCSTTAVACPACSCGWTWGWSGGTWTWWARGSWDGCRCGPYPAIDLGPDPVVEVTSVEYEGVALDPATYRVDGWRWLVRLVDADGDNPGWPSPTDIAAPVGGSGSLVVEWRHGTLIPPLVELAADALAHELLAGCGGESCDLPANVTQIVRQGATISLRDLTAALQGAPAATSGIPAVTRCMDAYNPEGWLAMPSVTDPDEPQRLAYPT